MGFLPELHTVAQDLSKYKDEVGVRPTPVTAAYRQTLGMIQTRVDQLACVFILAPFCYDTEQMYEKLKHSLCGILQLIEAQRKQQKKTLLSQDDDFLIVLSETLTQLCVRVLCEDNFIKIDACPTTTK